MLITYVPAASARDRLEAFIAAHLPEADEPGIRAMVADLTAPATAAWMAEVDGEIRAVFGAELRRPTVADPEYTYMPERYALVRMSLWLVADAQDWAYAPDLLDHIARDAAAEGITRLSVEIAAGAGDAMHTLLTAGFVPDVILAARATRTGNRTPPPGVRIRRARDEDAAALLALTLEEADYHAHHTASGIRPNQDPGPAREHVRTWLASERERDLPTFVAEVGGAVVGMLPLMIVDDAPALTGEAYGYVASTCVTASARRRGIATALLEHALDAAHARSIRVMLLHYVADNRAAGPLWEGAGFTPLILTLTRHPTAEPHEGEQR